MMQRMGIQPNSATLSTSISRETRIGDVTQNWAASLQVFEKTLREDKALINSFVVNSILHSLNQASKWALTLSVFQQCPERMTDSGSCGLAMHAAYMSGRHRDVLALFERAKVKEEVASTETADDDDSGGYLTNVAGLDRGQSALAASLPECPPTFPPPPPLRRAVLPLSTHKTRMKAQQSLGDFQGVLSSYEEIIAQLSFQQQKQPEEQGEEEEEEEEEDRYSNYADNAPAAAAAAGDDAGDDRNGEVTSSYRQQRRSRRRLRLRQQPDSFVYQLVCRALGRSLQAMGAPPTTNNLPLNADTTTTMTSNKSDDDDRHQGEDEKHGEEDPRLRLWREQGNEALIAAMEAQGVVPNSDHLRALLEGLLLTTTTTTRWGEGKMISEAERPATMMMTTGGGGGEAAQKAQQSRGWAGGDKVFAQIARDVLRLFTRRCNVTATPHDIALVVRAHAPLDLESGRRLLKDIGGFDGGDDYGEEKAGEQVEEGNGPPPPANAATATATASTGRMRKDDIAVYNALLYCCCAVSGNWQNGLAILQDIISLNLELDRETYRTIGIGFMRGGMSDRMEELVLTGSGKMLSLKLDPMPYQGLLEAASQYGGWQRCLSLISSMRASSLRPGNSAYLGLVRALTCNARSFISVEHIADILDRASIPIDDDVVASLMMEASLDLGVVEEEDRRETRRRKPKLTTGLTAEEVAGFRVSDLATSTFMWLMDRMQIPIGVSSYRILLKAYLTDNRWGDALCRL
eukprot:jgi/Bigna1/131800/aug1.15_g6508